MFERRMARVREEMTRSGVEVLLLSAGADLSWLIGYEAVPLERLTMLVVRADSQAQLVVPAFEVPRVVERPDLFSIAAWTETEDPVANVASLAGSASNVAIGDHTWSRFLIGLQHALPGAKWRAGSEVTAPLRAVKEAEEISRLQFAASSVDRVAAALQSGEIPLIGRTEAEVSAELSRRILAEGHANVNFAIVASGANAASPHHHGSDKVIEPGEVVLCDFGGTTTEPQGEPGYCSDITRCVYTGEPPVAFQEAYDVLYEAQASAVAAATVGTQAQVVDQVARQRMAEADLDQWFIHRLGHGIGIEEHEDPYLVDGNAEPLVVGNAFSVEPGFYIAGQWGARLEDIVVATEGGPLVLNHANHRLVVVEN